MKVYFHHFIFRAQLENREPQALLVQAVKGYVINLFNASRN